MKPADSTSRFSSRVENYVRYRPGYPPQLIPLLEEHGVLDARTTVADLGSGTGLSSLPFLAHGNVVYGVEPNAGMRHAAERLLSEWETFHSVDGTAESTTLPDQSVDLVVAAQAFHWFDHSLAAQECARILRPPRNAVVVWNVRKLDTTPFLHEYEQLLLDCGSDYAAVRHENVTPEILDRFFRHGFDTFVMPNEQTFDYAGLEGRLLSSSYAPDQGERHAEMLQRLRELFHRRNEDGLVRIEYDTVLYLGNV